MKILLTPEAGEGGTPIPAAQTPPVSTPPPAPPPAATAVLTGTKSERELQLETENEQLKKDKKAREIEAAELLDENHRLKSPPAIPTPAASAPEKPWRYRPIKRSQ
jgi:hypothetical protein